MKNEAVVSPEEQSWVLFGSFLRNYESARLLSVISGSLFETDQVHMESFFRKNEATHLEIISRTVAREARTSLLKNTLPKVFRIAAAVIAVLAVSLGIALAAVPELREYIGKMFVDTTSKYTEITMHSDHPESDPEDGIVSIPPVSENKNQNRNHAATDCSVMPKGWTGKNILTDLPETAVIVHAELDDVSQVSYKINPSSSAAWDISYSEYPGDTVIRLDTEDAEISEYFIHGSRVTAAVKEGLVSLWWNDEDTIFIFHGQEMTLPAALDCVRHIVPADKPGKTEREN